MRFDTEFDTPCPFRLARFGYRRIGEFRAPLKGELYIKPAPGPGLEEHEPQIVGACRNFIEPRHIVEPMPEGEDAEGAAMELLFDMLFGPVPETDGG